MKKVLIWISVLILVAVLSVVGTLAYLTAVDEETNVMTVGDASIKIMEYERVEIDTKNDAASVQAFKDNKHLRPTVVADGFNYANSNYNTPLTDNYVIWDEAHVGEEIKINGAQNYQTPIWNPDDITNEIDKMVFVKNTGDCNVYIRLCFAFEAGNYVRLDRFKQMVHLNLNTTDWDWDWNETRLAEIDGTRCFIAWATYKYPVAPDELTKISLSQIALDFSAINDHARAFGDTYDVKVFAQGIQSDGFATANAALTKGFDNDIPFKNVEFVEFTDLITALHYLNADTNDLMLKGESDNKPSQIVNSVTFGLTEDHPDVVKNRKGVLTANLPTRWDSGKLITEADFTAYTYYVPTSDGEQYDIYVLADNWKIFAPANSYGLFYQMKGLTKVDTSNIDFSYATSLQDMFRGCKSLQVLDTSDWDVSSVERMFGMFQNCTELNNIDVSGWNTTSLSNTQYMFFGCSKLTSLDVSNWDVSNLTSASHMFRYCGALTYLDVSRWKVDNVGGVEQMFDGCGSLQKLDVSDWKLNKVNSFTAMFQNCSSLVYLDVSKWTIDSATNTSSMFKGCSKLQALDVSSFKFKMENDININGMFQSCSALETLAVDNWFSNKTNKTVVQVEWAFCGCTNLKSLNLSEWNIKASGRMLSVFKSCSSLEGSLDLTGWDVSSVTSTIAAFKDCKKLKEIKVSGWDVGNVTNFDEMFCGCSGVTELDVGSWVNLSTNAKSMWSMFDSCSRLTSLELSKWDVSNVTDVSKLFKECSSLTTLDLSAWKTDKLSVVWDMFDGCGNLTAIYVSSGWKMENVTKSSNMFRGCDKLKNFNSAVVDKTNAHTGDGGYLTYKATADATT